MGNIKAYVTIYKPLFVKNLLVIVGLVCIVFFAIGIIVFSPCKELIGLPSSTPATWAQFGDFIGGTLGTILSFATVIYIVKTYKDQKIDAQRNEIENRFLKLIEIHRANADEIVISPPWTSIEIKGRASFKKIFEDFEMIRRVVVGRSGIWNSNLIKDLVVMDLKLPTDYCFMDLNLPIPKYC